MVRPWTIFKAIKAQKSFKPTKKWIKDLVKSIYDSSKITFE